MRRKNRLTEICSPTFRGYLKSQNDAGAENSAPHFRQYPFEDTVIQLRERSTLPHPTGANFVSNVAIMMYTGIPTVTLYEKVTPSDAANGRVGLASGIASR